MVLRHPETGDAYTFQTQQQKHDNRISGLQLDKNPEMRYDMEVAGCDCSNLAQALGVPSGGAESDVGVGLLTSRQHFLDVQCFLRRRTVRPIHCSMSST